jgi:hypothetical protein
MALIPQTSGRIADDSKSWQATCGTSITNWNKATQFILSTWCLSNVQNDDANFKLQWRRAAGTYADVSADSEICWATASTTLVDDTAFVVGQSAGCYAPWDSGEENLGDNNCYSLNIANGDYGEHHWGLHFGSGAQDSQEYEFQLVCIDYPASAEIDVSITTAAAGVVVISAETVIGAISTKAGALSKTGYAETVIPAVAAFAGTLITVKKQLAVSIAETTEHESGGYLIQPGAAVIAAAATFAADATVTAGAVNVESAIAAISTFTGTLIDVAATQQAEAAIAAASTFTCELSQTNYIQAAIAAASTFTGTLTTVSAVEQIQAAIDSASTFSGTLTTVGAAQQIEVAIAAASTFAATLSTPHLAASVSISESLNFSASGYLIQVSELSTSATSTFAAELSTVGGAIQPTITIPATSVFTASVNLTLAVVSAIDSQSTFTAALTAKKKLETTIPGTSTFTADLTVKGKVALTISIAAQSTIVDLLNARYKIELNLAPTEESGGLLIIDGEDAGSTPWEFDSLTEEGGNTFALDAGAAIHGSNGYKVTFAGSDTDCFAVKSFVAQTNVYVRYYINFAAWSAADFEIFQFAPIRDGTSNLIITRFTYRTATSKFNFSVYFQHNAAQPSVFNENGLIDINKEYCIEVQYKKGGIGTGGYSIWVNEILKGSDFTTYDTTNYDPDNVQIGCDALNIPDAGSIIYFDSIRVDTSYIGAYSVGVGGGQSVFAAEILIRRYLQAAIAAAGTATGTLTDVSALIEAAISIAAQSGFTALAYRLNKIQTEIQALAAVAADLKIKRGLEIDVASTSTFSSILKRIYTILVSIDGSSTVSANLTKEAAYREAERLRATANATYGISAEADTSRSGVTETADIQ